MRRESGKLHRELAGAADGSVGSALDAARRVAHIPRASQAMFVACGRVWELAISSSGTTHDPPDPGRESAPRRVPLISLADGGKAVGLLAMGLISWFVPESRWSGVCRLFSHTWRRSPHGGTRIAELIDGQGFPSNANSIYRASQAAGLESLLQLLRDYRPGRVEADDRSRGHRASGPGPPAWSRSCAVAAAGHRISLCCEGRPSRCRVRSQPPESPASRFFGDALRGPVSQPASDSS